MNEDILKLLTAIQNKSILFNEVMDYIDEKYLFTPVEFTNGKKHNSETQNQGSAKVFCFAKLHALSKEETLLLFAEHYQSVLSSPNGQDHENIRSFIQYGWDGISIRPSLIPK